LLTDIDRAGHDDARGQPYASMALTMRRNPVPRHEPDNRQRRDVAGPDNKTGVASRRLGGRHSHKKNSMVPWCFFSAWSSTIASDDALEELTTEEKLAEKPRQNKV